MSITSDNLLRSEFLFVSALYGGAREPAVLLIDLGEEEGRRVWDDLLNERFEAAAPWQEPSESLVLDADSSRIAGLATGRLKLMRILRDHLGETGVTKKLVEPPPKEEFYVVVMAGRSPTLLTARQPTAQV